MKGTKCRTYIICVLAIVGMILINGCTMQTEPTEPKKVVPHIERWGIYYLDLSTELVELIYSTDKEISGISLDHTGERLAFSLKGSAEILDASSEIYTIHTDGAKLQRLTNNNYFDAYPSFSLDGSKIVFLSKRNSTLSLYVMNIDGDKQQKLYDSGGHDADVNWGRCGLIVFTQNHQIWSLESDGTEPKQITDPPNTGQWGSANLPIGDYDPRLSPDCSKVLFARLEDPNTTHGGYNLFVINVDGTEETRLTNNGYTQGMPSWSHSGDKIVYVVAAINNQGKFDIHMMDANGTNNHKITPDYFPDNFLAHQAIFSTDDAGIFFIGQWWE